MAAGSKNKDIRKSKIQKSQSPKKFDCFETSRTVVAPFVAEILSSGYFVTKKERSAAGICFIFQFLSDPCVHGVRSIGPG